MSYGTFLSSVNPFFKRTCTVIQGDLNPSHLSAHVVNHLLCENRAYIPKILSCKKLFIFVTLQILNFIPAS